MNQSFHIHLGLKGEDGCFVFSDVNRKKRFQSSILLIPILSTCTGLEGVGVV